MLARRSCTVVLISAFAALLLAAPAEATFSGSNGRIAFSKEGSRNISSIKADGSGRLGLTHFPANTIAEYPKYSADGKWIVFDANTPTYPDASWDIYKMTAGGTHLRRLTSDTSNYDDWGGSFSPSGKRIAFISDRAGDSEVWMMGSDGSNPTQVSMTGNVEYTSWSPNGKWILYDSSVSGTDGIYEIHPNGTDETLLTLPPITGSGADWSPTGNQIAFSGSNSGGTNQIWVMSATGGKPHAITSQTYNAYNPVWSPDGRSIAFDEQVGTTEEVRAVARTGGKVHVLTKGSNPGWQPIH